MSPPSSEARILDAALATFVRFGFRKTSMDEVARAAHLSRQALYLHFATKEELFRATVRHALAASIEAASAVLGDGGTALETKLVRALDEWIGRYVEMAGSDVADLNEATQRLTGPLVADHEAQFLERLTKTLRSSGLANAYKPAGLTARQLADSLYATARGLKYACASRAELREKLAVAVKALCFPAREHV